MANNIWKEFSEELLAFINARVNNTEIAEDILQDVFVKIYENMHTLKRDEKLTSWVYQITRNTIIDHYRSRRIDTKAYELEVSLPIEMADSPFDFTKCLRYFITRLPYKYKDILLKTTYEHISQKAYAIENNLSYSAAKSRIQRARQKLKELFIEWCGVQADQYGNIISSNEQPCDC